MATAASGFRVTGIDQVLKNLNAAIEDIQGRTTAGILEAGLLVQARAMQRVPVEYGFLRASAFTQKINGLLITGSAEVGFHSAYALYVHENLEQKLKGEPRKSGLGVYWGPHGEPKFLESALRDSYDDILKIIAKRARPSGNAK